MLHPEIKEQILEILNRYTDERPQVKQEEIIERVDKCLPKYCRGYYDDEFICPNCGEVMDWDPDHCPGCDQVIDYDGDYLSLSEKEDIEEVTWKKKKASE